MKLVIGKGEFEILVYIYFILLFNYFKERDFFNCNV